MSYPLCKFLFLISLETSRAAPWGAYHRVSWWHLGPPCNYLQVLNNFQRLGRRIWIAVSKPWNRSLHGRTYNQAALINLFHRHISAQWSVERVSNGNNIRFCGDEYAKSERPDVGCRVPGELKLSFRTSPDGRAGWVSKFCEIAVSMASLPEVCKLNICEPVARVACLEIDKYIHQFDIWDKVSRN